MRSSWLTLFLLFFLLVLVGCMSAEDHKEEADRQGYGIVKNARKVAGQTEDPNFTIEMPEDRLRESLIKARSLDEEPGPRERLALEGGTVQIDLASALEIAARNSREFQTEKERLFSAALNFNTAEFNFGSQWFGLQTFSASANGDGGDDTNFSLSENGSFGFTRLLEAGGALSLSVGDNITRFLSNPASTVATTFASLSLSLPFLRGAGRSIVYENVNQAQRDVIYAVRTYERFKRTFAVNIISQYLRLLRDQQTVVNEKENFERRKITALENRALGEAGRLARTDVERANIAELGAENRWIIATQNFQESLDRFKITLGLPTDCHLEIRPEDLEDVRSEGADASFMEEADALVLATSSRLDLAISHGRAIDARRKVAVAKNALLAGLDFNANVNFNSNDFGETGFRLDPIGNADYALGFDIDLPLNRLRERNAYRQSIINFVAAKRNYEAAEDGVKLDVRSGLRSLRLAAESFRIQLSSLDVSQVNVDAATLLKDAGRGRTLDLLDAQNNLISAENALITALINFKISRLELLRDMGVLVVNSAGIDEEMTRNLLKKEG